MSGTLPEFQELSCRREDTEQNKQRQKEDAVNKGWQMNLPVLEMCYFSNTAKFLLLFPPFFRISWQVSHLFINPRIAFSFQRTQLDLFLSLTVPGVCQTRVCFPAHPSFPFNPGSVCKALWESAFLLSRLSNSGLLQVECSLGTKLEVQMPVLWVFLKGLRQRLTCQQGRHIGWRWEGPPCPSFNGAEAGMGYMTHFINPHDYFDFQK